MIFKEEQLEEACERWQSALRLRDWDVEVRIVRGLERTGSVTYDVGLRCAIISLLDPQDYPADAIQEQDHERTLVHELLHLHFAALDSLIVATPGDVVLEQGINSCATLMVELLRTVQALKPQQASPQTTEKQKTTKRRSPKTIASS